MTDRTYHAFISYSHSADGAFAPALQRGLQNLARHWRQRRAMEVFRDETGLAVDPNLWGAITRALDASDWFILLASPAAATSPWVGKEIEHTLATKGPERMIVVLTEGTLNWNEEEGSFTPDSDAAHPALAKLLTTAPVIFDLSWARTQTDLTLDNPRFRADLTRIAAILRDEPLATLAAQDARERRRTRNVVSLAVAALSVATALAVGAATTAGMNWRTAATERATAEAEAVEARSRELAAHSLATEDPRTALALAAEAYTLAPVAEHSATLLAAVAAHGEELVELPTLLPAELAGAAVISSARTPAGTERLTVVSEDGSVALDLDTGQRWSLPEGEHYLSPDGQRILSRGGILHALHEDATLAHLAALPPPDGSPVFDREGTRMAYRAGPEVGAMLVVVDSDGENLHLEPLPYADCRHCAGEATWVAISPDGGTVAVRSHSPGSEISRLHTYQVGPGGVSDPEFIELLGGPGSVYFPAGGSTVWVRDGGAVRILDPLTLEPAGDPMVIGRSGPLRYASDTLALAPSDNCTPPAVVHAPAMATVAPLPTLLTFAEGGCYDSPGAAPPQWLLEGTWVSTSAGMWPTDPNHLIALTCEALGGPVPAAEFAQMTTAEHVPTACEEEQ